jgi:hypothetical protein
MVTFAWGGMLGAEDDDRCGKEHQLCHPPFTLTLIYSSGAVFGGVGEDTLPPFLRELLSKRSD